MKNKGTLILFIVVILLSSYAYFGEYKGKEKEKATKEEQSRLFKNLDIDLKADQIQKVEVERGADKLVLEKSNEGWKLVSPVSDQADSESVDTWVKQLVDEKTLSVAVEGNDIQWQFFGFDKPPAKVTLTNQVGKSLTIEVSAKKNFEGNSFVRRPSENKIYVASSSWIGYSEKKVFDVRNKKVFRHQISNIQSVTIKNKKEKIVFESKEAKWISPLKMEWTLDQNAVRESIAKIMEATAVEIPVEGETAIKEKSKFHLDMPEIEFEIKLTDKTWKATMAQSKDKSSYMWVEELKLIAKVEPAIWDKFSALKLNAFRDLKLPFIAFEKSKVKEISLETNLKKSEFLEKNGQWQLEKEDKTVEVQQEKVNNFLEKVKDLSAFEYMSESEFNSQTKKGKMTQKIFLNEQDKKRVFEIIMSDSMKKKFDNTEKTVRIAKTNLSKDPFYIEDSEVEKLQINELTKIKNTSTKVDVKK